MSNLRKTLGLVVAAGVLAMALAAPAFATTPVEGILEDGSQEGTHCPPLAEGGCPAHAEGEALLRTHFFGVEANEARCHVEGEGAADEDGTGEMTSYLLTNGSHGESNCPTVAQPCEGSLPWTGTGEEIGPNQFEAVSQVCLDPAEFTTCVGQVDLIGQEVTAPDGSETGHAEIVDNRIGTSFCEFDMAGENEYDPQHPEGHAR